MSSGTTARKNTRFGNDSKKKQGLSLGVRVECQPFCPCWSYSSCYCDTVTSPDSGECSLLAMEYSHLWRVSGSGGLRTQRFQSSNEFLTPPCRNQVDSPKRTFCGIPSLNLRLQLLLAKLCSKKSGFPKRRACPSPWLPCAGLKHYRSRTKPENIRRLAAAACTRIDASCTESCCIW